MATLAVFAAFVVVAVLVGWVMSRLPELRHALARAGYVLFLPVLLACRIASAIVDFFLAPHGTSREIRRWKYAIWILIGLAPLGLFIAGVEGVVALPEVADPGYLLIVAAAFHVLVLAAALISIQEDYDVMDGVFGSDRRKIQGVRSATRPSVMAVSAGFFLVYAVAIAYWLAEVRGFDLFDKRPSTGVAVVDYMLVVLWSLPTELLVRPIDWFLGLDTGVLFKVTLVARAYYFTVYAVGSLLLVSLFSVALQMMSQLRRIVAELGEGREGERLYLLARARLAPPVIRRGILSAAISSPDKDRQKRLIDAARDVGIFTFPQTFLHNLETYDEEMQAFGIEKAADLFRQRAADFAREPSEAILRKGGYLLGRSRVGVESKKRMLRLMNSVLASKRGIVQLDEMYRDRVVGIINKALRETGPDGDAAYRGLLQELRIGVSRSVVATPTKGGPVSVGRGAQPGSPATTAPR